MYKTNNLYDKIGINKPIVLVGMMGAGKTTIGFRLAKKLDLPFLDTDKMVSKMVGCSISDIFKYQSEKYFYQKELEAIDIALNSGITVIATGGGAFLHDNVREMITNRSVSIWLRAPLETLLERVSRKNTRPLLEQGDKRVILESLMADRYHLYDKANIIIDSDISTHYHVVNNIITKLQQYLQRNNDTAK
jgi:shikimate kinase